MPKNLICKGLAVATVILLLGALSATLALAAGGQATINNKTPSINSVSLSPDDDAGTGGVQVNPSPGTTKAVTATISVKDNNGYQDIASVAVVVLKPDGSTTHIASTAATFDSGSGSNATYTYSFNMNFYDTAATGASTYKVVVTVTDDQAASANNSASPALFNYEELIALSLDSATINFGSLDPGATSSAYNLVGTNNGNVTLDFDTSGTNLVYNVTNIISIGRVDWDLVNTFAGATALTGTAQTEADYDLAPGAASSKSIYYRLRVPSGDDQYLPPGSYTGTINVTARAG